MSEEKYMNIQFPFNVDNTMKRICAIKGGPVIMGAWSKDMGTMELRLRLALVYSDGEVSPIHEYDQRKLTNAKALNDLAEMDGVKPELIEGIFKKVTESRDTLAVQMDRNGKCSLRQAYGVRVPGNGHARAQTLLQKLCDCSERHGCGCRAVGGDSRKFVCIGTAAAVHSSGEAGGPVVRAAPGGCVFDSLRYEQRQRGHLVRCSHSAGPAAERGGGSSGPYGGVGDGFAAAVGKSKGH